MLRPNRKSQIRKNLQKMRLFRQVGFDQQMLHLGESKLPVFAMPKKLGTAKQIRGFASRSAIIEAL